MRKHIVPENRAERSFMLDQTERGGKKDQAFILADETDHFPFSATSR